MTNEPAPKKLKEPTPPEPDRNLAQRLCAVMQDCAPIAKSGRNEAQNYKFIPEAAVAEMLRLAMIKHGVICLSSEEECCEDDYQTKSGGTMNVVRVKVRYTFINADFPEEKYEMFKYGIASDSSDKALNKASTAAHKYFLLRSFCLGAEDDADATGAERGAQQPHAKQPTTIQSVAGEYAVRIPYTEKDQWKGVLKAAGYRWHPESKTWRGSQPILALEKYQVDAAPDPAVDEPPPHTDSDITHDELPYG